jgi:hypothetical protein
MIRSSELERELKLASQSEPFDEPLDSAGAPLSLSASLRLSLDSLPRRSSILSSDEESEENEASPRLQRDQHARKTSRHQKLKERTRLEKEILDLDGVESSDAGESLEPLEVNLNLTDDELVPPRPRSNRSGKRSNNSRKSVHFQDEAGDLEALEVGSVLSGRSSISTLSWESLPAKSALKPLCRMSQQELELIRKREMNRMVLINRLRDGAKLRKYSSKKGEAAYRYFYVSSDGTELLWCKSRHFTKFTSSKIILASVKQIIMGPRTQGFKNFEWKQENAWLCFSLISESRNVDIQCGSKDEFDTWFFGLQHLVPLSHKFFNRAQVNWRRVLFKTAKASLLCEIPIDDVWHQIVEYTRSKEEKSIDPKLIDLLKKYQQESSSLELNDDM